MVFLAAGMQQKYSITLIVWKTMSETLPQTQLNTIKVGVLIMMHPNVCIDKKSGLMNLIYCH